MKIFVDFDDTMFDKSCGFVQAYKEIFIQSGVEEKNFFDTLHFAGEFYTPQKHVVRITKKQPSICVENILKNITQFLLQSKKFVFADIARSLQKFDRGDLIILSYGENDFQMQKIINSGLMKYVSDVIITQGDKAREIEMYMQDEPDHDIVAIDDGVNHLANIKKIFCTAITIHKLGTHDKCIAKTCDYHIKHFAQVCDILKK